MTTDRDPVTLRAALSTWFAPPRAHGEVIEDRTVSFIELFYDLVFVVLVGQLAHTLAEEVSLRAIADFTVLFTLVWIAWFNGSLYHDLHGGEDGRSRSYIFAQMLVLVVVAVFAGDAARDDGRWFGLSYALLLVLLAWQWFRVRAQDDARFAALTARYVAGMGALTVVVAASSFLTPYPRMATWAAAATLWIATAALQSLRADDGTVRATAVTDALAERFGLFVIIVLGEVVVGVVNGLAEAERTAITMVTGLVALIVGFGLWWNYFDFIGRRTPRPGAGPRMRWLLGHFPLTLSIAAAGAGMVSLVEHAGDGHTPVPTAWLLCGATALALGSLALILATQPDDAGLAGLPVALWIGAVAAVAIAALDLRPVWLPALLVTVLLAVWTQAFARAARLGRPFAAKPFAAEE